MPNLGANFYKKLIKVTSELQMNPEDLLCIMVSESGINPSALNPNGKAAGLIQFMPSTLKGLGYKGEYKDFLQLNGEAQLDWVKALIQGNMKINGGPFTSAAQFYLSNLFPVALKLKGIKNNDPEVKILEEKPISVNGFSKKYLDVGAKISIGLEKAAYNGNKGLFDKANKGSITFGDLIRQTENNKKNPLYKKALETLNQQTGYTPSKALTYSKKPTTNLVDQSTFMSALDRALKKIAFDKIKPKKSVITDLDLLTKEQINILKIIKKLNK